MEIGEKDYLKKKIVDLKQLENHRYLQAEQRDRAL